MEQQARIEQIYRQALRLPEAAPIPEQGDLVRYLGIDSISVMEILVWVEEEFGITVEDSDLKPALVDSVATLSAYIDTARARSESK